MLQKHGIDIVQSAQYYHFLQKVLRQYHEYGPHGRLHEARHAHLSNAITFCFQEMPATKLPHAGDVEVALSTIMPIMEELYKMPKLKHAGNPNDLKAKMLRPLEASIEDLAANPMLLDAWIDAMQKVGDTMGRPRLREGEVIPTAPYKMKDVKSRHNVWMPKALSGHPKMIPMRNSAVKKMVAELLEHGEPPCAVKAANTPSKAAFNNFNRVLYTAFVFYCKAEGLTIYHELARIALLYLFFGRFQTKSGCPAPVIRCIHKMMQVVSYRFDSTIDDCFVDIMK